MKNGTPIVEHIERLVLKLIRQEVPALVDKKFDGELDAKMEQFLEAEVPLAVTRELHRQFTGETKAEPSSARGGGGKKRKHRPKCEECGKAMRSDGEGGWECTKCGPTGGDNGGSNP